MGLEANSIERYTLWFMVVVYGCGLWLLQLWFWFWWEVPVGSLVEDGEGVKLRRSLGTYLPDYLRARRILRIIIPL